MLFLATLSVLSTLVTRILATRRSIALIQEENERVEDSAEFQAEVRCVQERGQASMGSAVSKLNRLICFDTLLLFYIYLSASDVKQSVYSPHK